MVLKITDKALYNLCALIGSPNPSSSLLNKFIETEILYNKSQGSDAFILMDEAINTYLVNRDKSKFSRLDTLDDTRKKVAIYIPCEYYAYIKEIFKYNENNKMLKRNYGAILNIIIYEYLIKTLNKSYIEIQSKWRDSNE